MIVHCIRGPNAGQVLSITDPAKVEDQRAVWEKLGNTVEVRAVDTSRDWNDRSDPVVRREEQEEHDMQEGRWHAS